MNENEYTTTVVAGVHLIDVKAADGDTSGTATPNQWLVDWMRGGVESDSGVAVNGSTALQFAPLWNAVSKIAGHVGQLPLTLYQRKDERSREKAKQHPGYRLMKRSPNEVMGATTFRETLQLHALLWGNGRAAIVRNNRNDADQLIPLDPATWHTVLVDGEKWHYTNSDPTADSGNRRIRDDDVLHVAGLGYDGICGYSVISMARNSLGLGLAAEKASSKHFKNNAVPSIVLEAPVGAFRDESDAKDFLNAWNSYHVGVDNSSKAGLLREGIKANALAMSGRDSQWIEQRLFQRQEAALWMCIESILGDDSSVSYNSLEAKNQAYLSSCLAKWLKKWEEESERKLLTDTQQRMESHFFKFNTAALLRGTTKERYEVYQIARMIGVMSANDVRELEDMNPVDDGDSYDNPAITTTEPAADQPETEDEPPQDRLRTVVQLRIAEVVAVEIKRVRTAAASTKNFVEWLDSFYGSFAGRLESVYQTCGGGSHLAAEHAAESKLRLLQVAGDSTHDTLSDNVEAELQTWVDRVKSETDDILNTEPAL